MDVYTEEASVQQVVSSSQKPYIIKKAGISGLKLALHWAKREGWNPCEIEAEAKALYALDPGAYFGVFKEEEMIAFIAAVTYDGNKRFAHIGIFIVRPEYRSRGIGKSLMNHVKSYLLLKGVESIYLNAIVNQVEWYKTFGFQVVGDNLSYRSSSRPELMGGNKKAANILHSSGDNLFEDMCKYDKACWGTDRTKFLQELLNQEKAYACIQKDQDGDKILGYGLIRPRQEGYRIGPLYSETSKDFEIVLHNLVSQISRDECIYIDMPDKSNVFYGDGLMQYFNFMREGDVFTISMTSNMEIIIPVAKPSIYAAIGSLEIAGQHL